MNFYFILQLIKETGGLKRLVALITDQVPPDEEAKGGKGGPDKGGKGSRAAKKSAKECKCNGEAPVDGSVKYYSQSSENRTLI